MQPDAIVKRFSQVEAQRRVVQQQWDDISLLVVPYRGDFWNLHQTETSTDWRENRNVFDSTAINACQTLAASLHGSLTSPSVKWFELRFRDDELNSDKEANAWLSKCGDTIFTTLQESNFDLEANEAYLDLCSFGTAMIGMESEYDNSGTFTGVDFQAIPLKEGYYEADNRGRVINFYRHQEMTPLQILTKFGEDTPESIKEKAIGGDVDQRLEVIFCIFERSDKPEDNGEVRAAKERRFGYRYVLRKTAEPLGEEGGYYFQPMFAPKWRKTSGSQWGNSPAMVALPDIKTLNAMVELGLAAAEKAIDPVILAEERSLFQSLDMRSGSINVVKNPGGIVPLESASRFDVEFAKEEQYRTSIRQTFYNDQLQLKDSPAMTATEVRARFQLMQRLLGPTLGRLKSDWLDPTIQKLFNILYREGQFDEMPDIVRERQAHMAVEYVGALASAQKTDKVNAIDAFVEGAAAMSQFEPEVLDKIDFDAVVDERAKALNVPLTVMKSKEQVKQTRRRREAQQQQAQQAELATMEGQAMKAQGEGMAAIDSAGAAA